MNDLAIDNHNDSSEEPLIEIPKISGTELVRKSHISNMDIRGMVVRCTSCLHQINHHDPDKVKKHFRLNVIVCNDCSEFYGTSEFSQDESGNYNYCTWCGNGGKLYLCDFCPNTFCSTCVRRNFGRAAVTEMSKEGWKCYMCNPEKLKTKVAFCDLILEYCKNARERKDKKINSVLVTKQNGIQNLAETHDWVLSAFDATGDTCKSFHKRLEKLKNIGMSQSKSLKHIIKKFEDIVNVHKGELNLVIKSLSRQYNSYLQAKKKSEEQKELKNNIGKTDLNNEPNNEEHSHNGLDVSVDDRLKDKVLSDDNNKSKIIEDNYKAKLSLLNFSDSSLSGDESKVSNVVEDESKISNVVEDESKVPNVVEDESKIPNVVEDESKVPNVIEEESKVPNVIEDESKIPNVVKDESKVSNVVEDDHDDKASLKTKEKIKSDETPKFKDALDINDKNMSDSGTTNSDVIVNRKDKKSNSGSNFKISLKKNKVDKKPVSRKLSFDSSVEELADSESSINFSSDTDENKKSNKKFTSKLAKSMPKIHKTLDYNDPKLKMKTSVVIKKCDDLLVNGETTVPLPESYILERMDKEINALLKEPKKKTKSNMPKNSKEAPQKEKAPRKKKISESSSSICLSSSGEETEPNMNKLFKFNKKVDDPNTIAKKGLLDSDESIFTESEEDTEPQKKKSKKNKAQSGSSDDFQPRKKRKFDKLLNKRIISDDEDDKKEKKDVERKPSTKRRNIASDDSKSEKKKSDIDTTTSTTDSEEEKQNKKKKRKRIKKAAISSSSDEKAKEDAASQNTPAKGRKNINKILSKEDLTIETKEAQNLEKERRKRVQERQKLYNIITDTSADGSEIITRKMVLEIDPDSKEEIVEIHPDLVDKLKPHQVKGVKFMWECTIESVKRLEKEPGSGCILAHCMGLGKTLQVIAFLHTCLTNKYVKKHLKTALVICPYNTVLNWSREFDHWMKFVDDEILIHELTMAKDNYTRIDILNYWNKDGGVMILSYDLFRRLASPKKIKKLSSRSKAQIYEHLVNPGPDIVICDEGHILKNVSSAISKACSTIATERRIVLTGTPLQNNLLEYHCMLSFVKPHLLGTPKEFRNRFVNPIMNGQYDDSNEYDVKRMKKRIHILHKLLEGCVQRCDYSALTKFLPPKHEFVISVKLSETQIKMYRWYLENLSRARTQEKIQGSSLFMDYNVLRNLCAHPFIVRRSCERAEKRKLLKGDDSESDFINDATEDSPSAASKSDDSEREEVVKVYKTRSRNDESDIESEEPNDDEEKHWYDDFISEGDKCNIELSGKIILLVDILKECEAIGDKVIVFSQSLLTFDLLEDLLSFLDQEPVSEEDKLRDVRNSWTKNVDYFRMDGSTSAEFRKQFIDHFNDPANDRARLFLVSTKAGGLGTNLVGANRVIMLDASWNPSHDVQAIFRVYRFGQRKPVYIYRLLAQGTMEEKIYDRQVTKLSLSIRVVDEQQIDRHFNAAELAELYNFEPESQPNRPTPIVPKDTLLAEMLIKYADWIVTYHEHDSLLQNETEEDLTEEERKAAWTEYENEREGRFANVEEIPLDEDMTEFCKEPDFTEANYEGALIPPVKSMIESIIARLKHKFPASSAADLRKKLLTSLFGLRAIFLEKHVKILRMKQEYVAKGSVPVVVNKYLEELNSVVKSLTNHYENVAVMVNQDNKIAMQAQNQQFIGNRPPFVPYNVGMPNRPTGVAYAQPRQQYVPRYTYSNTNVGYNNMNFNPADPRWNHIQANAKAYATFAEALKQVKQTGNIRLNNPNIPQTVVTEVDRDEPKSNKQNTNPHSTVVIEEIE